MTGWVKIHRRILDSWIWRLPMAHRMVAIQCLLEANWGDCEGWRDGKRVTVARGTFDTTQRRLAESCGVSRATLNRALANLETGGFLKCQPVQGGTTISIVNFDRYQSLESDAGPQASPQASPSVRQPTFYKRRKEEKKGRTPKKATQLPDCWSPSSAHVELGRTKGVDVSEEADSFRDYCRANGKTYKNHDAAFSNWLRRAAKWQSERASKSGRDEPYQPPLRIV